MYRASWIGPTMGPAGGVCLLVATALALFTLAPSLTSAQTDSDVPPSRHSLDRTTRQQLQRLVELDEQIVRLEENAPEPVAPPSTPDRRHQILTRRLAEISALRVSVQAHASGTSHVAAMRCGISRFDPMADRCEALHRQAAHDAWSAERVSPGLASAVRLLDERTPERLAVYERVLWAEEERLIVALKDRAPIQSELRESTEATHHAARVRTLHERRDELWVRVPPLVFTLSPTRVAASSDSASP